MDLGEDSKLFNHKTIPLKHKCYEYRYWSIFVGNNKQIPVTSRILES
jgi:hypothetical protein